MRTGSNRRLCWFASRVWKFCDMDRSRPSNWLNLAKVLEPGKGVAAPGNMKKLLRSADGTGDFRQSAGGED